MASGCLRTRLLTVLLLALLAPPAIEAGFAADRDTGDAATTKFEVALAEARAAHNAAGEAEALRGIGTLLYKQARYAEARDTLLSALQLYEALGNHREIGWTLHYLGQVAYHHETGEAANHYWTRGLAEMEAAGDRRGQAQLLCDRALVTRPGPERAALLERSLHLAREAGDARTEATAVYRIGLHQFWEGSYAAAFQTLQQALGQFERIGAEDLMAEVMLQLARFHELHGRPDRSGAFYERALGILQRLDDKEQIAQALGAIVNMHRVAGELRKAVTAARRLVALRIEMDSAVRVINSERVRLAHLYVAIGDHVRAKALLDEVIRGPNELTRNQAYDPLAAVYLARGEYEQAREAADLAARFTREPRARPFMLANRARAEEKLGHSNQALATIDEALDSVEHAREQLVQTDEMKQGYGERLQQLFAFAIELRVRHGRTKDALEAAERARARAFLDLLAMRRIHAETGKQAGTAHAPVADQTDSALESDASARSASIDELAQIARRLDSTIVSYWVGPTTTFVWIVDREGNVNVASVPVSSRRLASLIGETSAEVGRASARGDLLIAEGRTPIQAWRELHDLLIRPVARLLPRARGSLLTIVPHGPLFRLSFAALVDAQGAYLIERYAMHYVPSAGSLLYLRPTRAAPDNPARYLLIADPKASAGAESTAGLPPLPGAAREVAAIRKILPPDETDVLTDARASESAVRRLLGRRAVVHLATHGVLRDDRPFDSFLALGGRGRDAATDGRLTTAEIYDLALDADLVVLSACRSAQGPVTGDGVLGMTRAFMYAGASSVVATLWDVADQAGAELMPTFYRTWRGGRGKSTALRAAQLQLLARLREGRVQLATAGGDRALVDHPFLWAGFVLLGEP